MKNKKNLYGWFANYGDDVDLVFGKLSHYNGGSLYFPYTTPGVNFGAYNWFSDVEKNQVNKLMDYIIKNHNNSYKTRDLNKSKIDDLYGYGIILYNKNFNDIIWTKILPSSSLKKYKYAILISEDKLRNIML